MINFERVGSIIKLQAQRKKCFLEGNDIGLTV